PQSAGPADVVRAGPGQATAPARGGPAGGGVLAASVPPELASGAKVLLSMRPEQLRLESSPGDGRIAGVVKTVLPLGPQVVYEVEIAGTISLKVSEPRASATALRQAGDSVHVPPTSPAACRVFPQQ